ncbi:MAG: glycosyltransferase family 2 protein [Phycisphaeraceae bacterium]
MSVLIAIPVYNEQNTVQPVLSEVSHYASNVLVVDDGSTDATPTRLATLPVDVIRHRTNLGYGRSIRDSFRWAECYRYDWLVTMDCDEQHEPASLPDFFEAIEKDDADIISGSRYLDDRRCGTPPPEDRRNINAEMTALVNETLSLGITDAFCGFKAYRVSALKKLDLDVSGYAIPLQVWVQAAASGLRVKEVPIRLIYTDAKRSFGGPLDDPDIRLKHYRDVFEAELSKHPELVAATAALGGETGDAVAARTGSSSPTAERKA